MLFDIDNPIVDIMGVEDFEWGEQTRKVPPREFSVLAFRLKGSSSIYYDEKSVTINQNDISFFPQNIGYTAEYSDTKVIAIHFKTQTPLTAAEVFTFENTEKFYKLFLEALNTWQNKNMGYKYSTLSIIYKIISSIYKETQKNILPKNFINAISLINANYKDNDLSIYQICREAQISETHFRKLFSKYYNKAPITYINELRIDHARNLISNDVSIEKAAYESGFNDPKYFSRVVKKHFNCTPRELKSYGK